MTKQQQQQFPTETVTLPSKGILYPEDSPLSKGHIEMKYMTAREEDILTNQNYIENGIVVDKLLQSLIVTENINYNQLLIGDKNAILIAARILGYGSDYTFEYRGQSYNIDLTEAVDKNLDKSLVKEGKNEFDYTLPTSKIDITFKLMTHEDETKISKELEGLKKLDKLSSKPVSTRLKHTITSINGDYEKKTIREFVDNKMLARDARALRKYISDMRPDVDLTFEYEDERTGNTAEMAIPIGVGFFWPDADV